MQIRNLGFWALLAISHQATANAQPQITAPPAELKVISSDELSRALGGPTLVSLHFKNATPQQVAAEFAKQTGLTLRDYAAPAGAAPPPGETVTIDLDRRPFWTALREVGEKLNCNLSVYESNLTLSQKPQGGRALTGRSFTAGPLVSITANQASLTQTVQFSETPAAGETQRALSLFSLVQVDPKVRVLRRFAVGELTVAEDEKGRSLLPERPQFSLNTSGASQWFFQMSLAAPTGMSGRAKIAGKLRLPVVLRQERWEINDLNAPDNSKTVTGSHGAEKYTLQEIKRDQTGHIARIKVERPAAAPDILAQIWSGRSELAHLFDAKNSPLMSLSSRVDGSTIELRFWGGGTTAKNVRPARLTLDIPVEVRQLEVPFELSGLQLP